MRKINLIFAILLFMSFGSSISFAKCGNDKNDTLKSMKCGAGKCGKSMKKDLNSTKKCNSSKCGKAMKCGLGKCGSGK